MGTIFACSVTFVGVRKDILLEIILKFCRNSRGNYNVKI